LPWKFEISENIQQSRMTNTEKEEDGRVASHVGKGDGYHMDVEREKNGGVFEINDPGDIVGHLCLSWKASWGGGEREEAIDFEREHDGDVTGDVDV